jgi:hypothetical protein
MELLAVLSDTLEHSTIRRFHRIPRDRVVLSGAENVLNDAGVVS